MMKKLLILLVCLLMTACALAEDYSLPIDFSGGYKPDPDGFTQDSYEDASLSVKMEKRDIDNVRYDIAWIKIASPTQLRTAIAGKPNQITSEKPTRMSRKNNAVVAINGDYYVQRKDGLIYRQGQAFRYILNPETDILVIDDLGDLHVFLGGENQSNELLAFLQSGRTIINAFTFGPAIVKDGKALPMPDTYQTRFDSAIRAPRTVIAQIGPLEYMMVVVDGRRKDSDGCSVFELGQWMLEQGCVQAYNLDGGNSALMWFGGENYSDKTVKGERSVSDIIYIATAVDHGLDEED